MQKYSECPCLTVTNIFQIIIKPNVIFDSTRFCYSLNQSDSEGVAKLEHFPSMMEPWD